MKLAVLMSVYNNQDTLIKALDSVLGQTYKKFEFIIINDASTDKSTSILAQYQKKDSRIKLINNERHLGLTKSLNKGLKTTKAKYIARMDADDISLPKRFEKQLAFFKSHPKVSYLGSAAYLINPKSKKLGLKRHPIDHQHIKKIALKYCPFIHPTIMFNRLDVKRINNYNDNFIFAQDYELALRVISQYQTTNLPEPLLKYRVDSPSAISIKKLKEQEQYAIKARLLALTQYGYSSFESWKLIKPLLSYLVPVKIKTVIYNKFYWK